MARYIYINFLMFCLFITPAFAGFEWVPPAKNPAPIAPKNFESPVMERLPAVPAPVVAPLPIPMEPGLTQMPAALHAPISAPLAAPAMPILPSRQSYASVQHAPAAKNLSGKKLVINPYPLKQGVASSNHKTRADKYKSMNEESRILNPVQLGNGLSTGVRKRSVSHPVRMASSEKQAPNKKMGMTPMKDVKRPAPSYNSGRQKIQNKPIEKYAEAVGFGRDLPLELALSQIIPSDYTHNLAKDVDASISVSWEGGKSWDQVLDDMLKSKNLMAVIQGNQVIIQPLAHI